MNASVSSWRLRNRPGWARSPTSSSSFARGTSCGTEGRMALPNFEQSTRIVGRALGLTGSAWPKGFRRAVVDDLTDVIAFRREHLALPMAEADPAYLAWRYRFGREGRGLGDLWVFRVNGQL